MIISESTWVFTWLNNSEDDSFLADSLKKGELVTILELNTAHYMSKFLFSPSIDKSTHYVLINDELRCIINDKQLAYYFLPLEEWRCSKINSILSD